MTNTEPKPKTGLLTFSTRSYPTFGRQRKPFDEKNPPNTVTDSPYYWWYMFLKLHAGYKQTCEAVKKDEFVELFEDFGNVHTMNFKEWWQARVELFAEPKKGYRMMIANSMSDIAPFNSDEVINLVVPLNRTQRSLKKAFSMLVLRKVEKGKRGVSVESSGAKYRLSGKWHIEAMATAYKIYTIKKQSEADGTKYTWADIAIKAKLPMSFALEGKQLKSNSDIKRTLTILAKRHFDRAEKYINNAASNSFP